MIHDLDKIKTVDYGNNKLPRCYLPSHLYSNSEGKVFRFVLRLENELNRKLTTKDCPHAIVLNPKNVDSWANLYIALTRSDKDILDKWFTNFKPMPHTGDSEESVMKDHLWVMNDGKTYWELYHEELKDLNLEPSQYVKFVNWFNRQYWEGKAYLGDKRNELEPVIAKAKITNPRTVDTVKYPKAFTDKSVDDTIEPTEQSQSFNALLKKELDKNFDGRYDPLGPYENNDNVKLTVAEFVESEEDKLDKNCAMSQGTLIGRICNTRSELLTLLGSLTVNGVARMYGLPSSAIEALIAQYQITPEEIAESRKVNLDCRSGIPCRRELEEAIDRRNLSKLTEKYPDLKDLSVVTRLIRRYNSSERHPLRWGLFIKIPGELLLIHIAAGYSERSLAAMYGITEHWVQVSVNHNKDLLMSHKAIRTSDRIRVTLD